MKNARFTWQYPNVRTQGGPLLDEDIVGAEIAIRITGAPDWTVLDTVPHPTAELIQNELDVGDYEARCVVITDGNQRGEPALLSFTVSDDSPAAAVSGFAVELT